MCFCVCCFYFHSMVTINGDPVPKPRNWYMNLTIFFLLSSSLTVNTLWHGCQSDRHATAANWINIVERHWRICSTAKRLNISKTFLNRIDSIFQREKNAYSKCAKIENFLSIKWHSFLNEILFFFPVSAKKKTLRIVNKYRKARIY